jgi:hypothetical protein
MAGWWRPWGMRYCAGNRGRPSDDAATGEGKVRDKGRGKKKLIKKKEKKRGKRKGKIKKKKKNES